MKFHQPDPRFNVAVASAGSGHTRYLFFAHTMEQKSPHKAQWRKIKGANAILIGSVDDALRGLLHNYTNKELQEKIGLHPTPAATLRRYLK